MYINSVIVEVYMSRLDSGAAVGKKAPLLKRIFANNGYCWTAALCTAGLMMLVFFCYGLYPFGTVTILRMDMYHQYGPLFAELYDRVVNMQSFLYSWQTGLGSPFLGNFLNYLSSPSALIVLLLGHENVPEAIAGMILAKAACSAFTFTYFLKKSQNRHDFTSAAFGVLYSMCGWFVAYYWNVMWIDAMVFFPLVILGIEKIINSRKPLTYIFALSATLITSYYMGYMVCIFSVLYFIVYYFSIYELSSHDIPVNPDDSLNQPSFFDKVKHSVLLKSGFTFAFSSIAAAGLVAFALIPVYFILQNCSATSGTFPEDWKTYFSAFDFLANHIASVVPTIRSSGDDVLPNVYCGIATLMLVPLYLFTKSISIKEKIAHVALLGVLFLSFNLNILNYIWHGFHYPNDLPYRFSFMYCFILILLAFKAFVRLKEFSGRAILGTGVALTFALVLVQEIGSKNVEDLSLAISVIFVVTYCLVFVLSKNQKYPSAAVAVLLLCCVIGEIACANTDRYSMDQQKANYAGDYQEFKDLQAELEERENGEFFRMDTTFNRARMSPAWYGYNGVSTFTSMAYEDLANLQSDLGIYGNYINSYTYYLQTPIYNMMFALDYVLDNNDEVDVQEDYFEYVGESSNGVFTAYENKYQLPIGFLVNSDVKEWYTDIDNPFTVQGDWLEYSTGVMDVFDFINIVDSAYYNVDELEQGFDTGEFYLSKTNAGEDAEVTFEIFPDEEQHCYLYVDTSATDTIYVTRDEKTVTQDIDECYILDIGICSPDDTVLVTVPMDSDKDYCYLNVYAYGLNDEAFLEAYDILKAGALDVETFEETYIKGSVTAKEDCLLYTSIPYDTGWTVTVDGKKVSEDDIVILADSLLAVKLGAGEHTVEFSYLPDGLFLGFAISGGTVLVLIAAIIFFTVRRKRREKNKAEAEAENALSDTPFTVHPLSEDEQSPSLYVDEAFLAIADSIDDDDPFIEKVIENPVEIVSGANEAKETVQAEADTAEKAVQSANGSADEEAAEEEPEETDASDEAEKTEE